MERDETSVRSKELFLARYADWVEKQNQPQPPKRTPLLRLKRKRGFLIPTKHQSLWNSSRFVLRRFLSTKQ